MMKKVVLYAVVFIASWAHAESGYYVVEAENSKDLLEQCSRETPKAEGYWTPSKDQIAELENNLEKLEALEADHCCGSGKLEKSAREYPRQYGGIIVNGEKVIYINAGEMDMVCDGGKRYWGAVYHPTTKAFSQLVFNGSA